MVTTERTDRLQENNIESPPPLSLEYLYGYSIVWGKDQVFDYVRIVIEIEIGSRKYSSYNGSDENVLNRRPIVKNAETPALAESFVHAAKKVWRDFEHKPDEVKRFVLTGLQGTWESFGKDSEATRTDLKFNLDLLTLDFRERKKGTKGK